MKAGVGPDEAARLDALRRYDVLDTPRESDFDDVVDLVAQLCAAPVALISLVDVERQWFKAEVGLGIDATPIAQSICAHAILGEEVFEIPDTQLDPRTADNPLCQGDNAMRFYAGAPLRGPDRLAIGTLCVLDRHPRQLTPLQRRALTVLAAQVVAQLDLRATLRREALLRKEIDHRVKNSLNNVSAFARLQSRAAANVEAGIALAAVEQQIGTVALLHELLSEVDDHDVVDLATYLDRLTDLLARATPEPVEIAGQFAPLPVRPAAAGALGAVINELVANAVKHSFGDGSGGRIDLTGTIDGDSYRIVCEDDGVPVAASPEPAGRGGLGLKIIAGSVRQLGGSIAAAPTSNGYRSVVEFPVAVR